MPKTIQELPEELIANIFDHFATPLPIVILNREDDFDRIHGLPNRHGYTPEERADLKSNFATLCSLAVVSKVSNRIAESILYRTYPGRALIDPSLFLAALAARPHRTNFVRRVLINKGYPGDASQDWDRIRKGCRAETYTRFEQEMGESTEEALRPWPEDKDLNFIRLLDTEVRGRLGLRTLRLRNNCEEYHIGLSNDDYRRILQPIFLPGEIRRHLRAKLSDLLAPPILIAILMACPQIRSLSMDPCIDMNGKRATSGMVPYIVRACNHDLRRSSIEHVSLASSALLPHHPSIDEVARRWEGISIESLSLHTNNAKGAGREQSYPGLSSVTTLQLTKCPIDKLGLQHIFESCPNLTKLSIVSPEELYVGTPMTEIGDALRMYGTKLTDLTVAWLDWSANSWPYWQLKQGDKFPPTEWSEDPPIPVEAMGSLRTLSNLSELTITIWEMLGVGIVMETRPEGHHLIDMLPSGLRKLTILGCNEAEPDKICAVTNEELSGLVRSERFADLQVVRADLPEKYVCDAGPEWKHSIGPLDKRLDCGHGFLRHAYCRVDRPSSS